MDKHAKCIRNLLLTRWLCLIWSTFCDLRMNYEDRSIEPKDTAVSKCRTQRCGQERPEQIDDRHDRKGRRYVMDGVFVRKKPTANTQIEFSASRLEASDSRSTPTTVSSRSTILQRCHAEMTSFHAVPLDRRSKMSSGGCRTCCGIDAKRTRWRRKHARSSVFTKLHMNWRSLKSQ